MPEPRSPQTKERNMAQVAQRYVGGGVLRKEDPRLLTGQGRYVDDLALPGMVWMGVVRSPLAHARIKAVDTGPALQIPGVLAAFTGEELAGDWAGPLPCVWPVTEDIKMPQHWPVTRDKARYMGDAVAVVVAESRELAQDAVEAVVVDYEALPAVTNVEAALSEDAPLVHDDFGTNKSFTWSHGGTGDVERTFAEAPVVVHERYWHPRLIPNAMEPRGVLVQPTPSMGEFTMWSATQIPHVAKLTLSMVTGIPESKLRVIAPEVGGGFGSKLDIYAEEALCLALARRLRRPVKWVEERSEGYLATIHGRGVLQDMELAATAEGKLLGIRARLQADSGDYEATLARALDLVGYEELRKEQQIRREQGTTGLLGIGLSTYIENCGWAPSHLLGAIRYAGGGWDSATIRVLPTGKVVVATGTSPHGQGHETTWSQIVADALGVPYEDVEVLHGDTAVSPLGMDTYGSRSLAVGGVALMQAADKVIDKARKLAAHELEVAEPDLDYESGRFSVKGAPKSARTIPELAFSAWHAHNLPPE